MTDLFAELLPMNKPPPQDAELLLFTCEGAEAYYRPGTTDLNTLKEVIERKAYRRKGINFDVLKGERWLDLGANIGAFAVYCKQKGASATCYEPDAGCFEVLRRNVPSFDLNLCAVTAQEADTIAFHGSRVKGSHIRGSEFSHYWRAVGARRSLRLNGTVQNLCAKSLVGQVFDGVKMDIEGSEGPILDYGWLPRCDKLVLEYHSSIDTSLAKLASRLAFLKSRFHHVAYPPEYDLAIESGAKEHKGYFDRNIFAMGWK